MKANDPYNRRLLINDTIARLRELEGKASELPWEVTAFVTDSDDHNDNDAILIAETRNALHALLDHIEGLEATIGKHERMEDEHCRQIEGKDKKLKLMNDVSRLAQTKIADLERKNALLLENVRDANRGANTNADALQIMSTEVNELSRKNAELEKNLEIERMRLAGCGTAALGYFDGKCSDDYWSASLKDVLTLRESADELQRKNALLLAVAKVAKQLKFRVETVVEKQIADEFIKTLKAAKDGKAM